mgnify:CR=1 FL=1
MLKTILKLYANPVFVFLIHSLFGLLIVFINNPVTEKELLVSFMYSYFIGYSLFGYVNKVPVSPSTSIPYKNLDEYWELIFPMFQGGACILFSVVIFLQIF